MPAFDAAELAEWSGGTWDPEMPREIRGIGNDSRTVARGSLYVALKGAHFDGHDFVRRAFERGASGAAVDREWAAERAHAPVGPLLRVNNTAAALRDMARSYRRKVSPAVVGVTGSAGKTTVKDMTVSVLSRAMRTAGTPGNWNNNIGLPLSLLAMERDTEAGVFEIATNHPGEIAELCGVLEPECGVITNIGPAHMEFFGSIDAVAEEKGTLFDALPDTGAAILNIDIPCRDLVMEKAGDSAVTVSLTDDADYTCSGRDDAAGTALIRERATGTETRFHLRVPGAHNLVNAMLAAAVGRMRGLDWPVIAGGLRDFRPSTMRWERRVIRGMTVINDAYNANPLSMRAAITAFLEMRAEGTRWLALGGMMELGDRTRREHLELGRFVAERAAGRRDIGGLVTVGALGELIAAGAAELGGMAGDRIFKCADNERAARTVHNMLGGGDAVLIKGSRMMRLETIVDILEAMN